MRSLERARRRGQLIDPDTGRLWARRSTSWLRGLIPTLAVALADRLQGLQDSPASKALSGVPTLDQLATHELIKTHEWRALMNTIAFGGVRTPLALQRADISPWVFRRYVRSEPRLQEEFNVAKKYAKRRRWPELLVNEIFDEITGTNVSLQRAVMRRGFSKSSYISLLRIIWRKPEWRSRYLLVKGAQSTRLGLRLLDLDDAALLSLGCSGIRKQGHAMARLRPLRLRKAEAAHHRAARDAKLTPAELALSHARRRAKRYSSNRS